MGYRELMSGYGGYAFPLPSIAGQFKGRNLVICGDAIGVWTDLQQFACDGRIARGQVRKDGWDFMTINKMVETFPGDIVHCYSNEPHLLHKFIAARRSEYAREFCIPTNTHSCNDGARWRWPWGGHGTSGLGATLVGVGLGYEKIVLCGLPLDDGPHNGEPPWRKCGFASREAAGSADGGPDQHWRRARDEAFEGKVKSMSGRTKDWLGDARDWL